MLLYIVHTTDKNNRAVGFGGKIPEDPLYVIEYIQNNKYIKDFIDRSEDILNRLEIVLPPDKSAYLKTFRWVEKLAYKK
ncbi:MAG: hypothetical protein LBS74_11825 [Oscillospiraceae bacterium]|nr:hypothetical protein [Oscillospiraceae bacterium]